MKSVPLLGLLALLCLIAMSACSSPPARDSIRPGEIRHDAAIIFIPGFYGTALAEARSGDRLFLTFGQALWGGTPLAVDDPDLGVEGAVGLRPDGLLERISILPGIYSIDAYGDSFEFFRKEFGEKAEVIALTYDWRKDIHLAIERLAALVNELRAARVSSIALVGHSMGGMITSYYLRYGDQDFAHARETWEGAAKVKTAILGGVPFRGSMFAFHNMQTGTSLGLAKTPLSAISLSTFAGLYDLLPAPRDPVFLNDDHRPTDADFHAEALWARWSWGLLRGQKDLPAPVRTRRREATRLYLERAREFSQLLNATGGSAAAPHTPVLNLIGVGKKTLAKAVWTASDLQTKAGSWDWSDPAIFDDGDGTVTAASAAAPTALEQGTKLESLSFPIPHESLYAKGAPQKKIVAFLRGQGF